MAVGILLAHHPGLQPYDDIGFDLDSLDALTLRQMMVGWTGGKGCLWWGRAPRGQRAGDAERWFGGWSDGSPGDCEAGMRLFCVRSVAACMQMPLRLSAASLKDTSRSVANAYESFMALLCVCRASSRRARQWRQRRRHAAPACSRLCRGRGSRWAPAHARCGPGSSHSPWSSSSSRRSRRKGLPLHVAACHLHGPQLLRRHWPPLRWVPSRWAPRRCPKPQVVAVALVPRRALSHPQGSRAPSASGRRRGRRLEGPPSLPKPAQQCRCCTTTGASSPQLQRPSQQRPSQQRWPPSRLLRRRLLLPLRLLRAPVQRLPQLSRAIVQQPVRHMRLQQSRRSRGRPRRARAAQQRQQSGRARRTRRRRSSRQWEATRNEGRWFVVAECCAALQPEGERQAARWWLTCINKHSMYQPEFH